MLVGGPLAGKTKVLEVLAETLNSLNQKGIDEDKVINHIFLVKGGG